LLVGLLVSLLVGLGRVGTRRGCTSTCLGGHARRCATTGCTTRGSTTRGGTTCGRTGGCCGGCATTRDERAHQLELDAAVLGARGVELRALEAGRRNNRLLVAEAGRGQATVLDALLDEVRLHCLGARLRERLVVGELAACLDRLVVGVA